MDTYTDVLCCSESNCNAKTCWKEHIFDDDRMPVCITLGCDKCQHKTGPGDYFPILLD